MSFLKKKCEYCKNKIDKDKEIVRDVKDPVFIGTRPKNFCSKEYADNYGEKSSCCKESGGGCCG
ncbi:hypothetical protein GW931_03010 [archaeon]|nr:hypothetical protein [archaeon]PJC45337.1 MAG: hypothetical protein CO037_01960 [Candidatus Pacearchaeota archaeon CG_4_9_14_0_2_um_filter_30_8]